MNLNEELLFSRHLLLSDVSELSQAKIRSAEVLVVGAGGLGCPAALFLASAGVGRLRWVDGDKVELTNLPRQVLYGPDDVGRYKVDAGEALLRRLSPLCHLTPHQEHGTATNLPGWIESADLVLDCTDRFETRNLINKLCVQAEKPLIIASVIQWAGQLLRVDPDFPETGCYACLFPGDTDIADAACGAYGVFSTAAGLMGVMQANEALRKLAGLIQEEPQLYLFDAKMLSIERMKLRRRTNCPVCSGT